GALAAVRALERTEWAVLRARSTRPFDSKLFTPADVASERRGEGLAQGASVRTVRLVFDQRTRPESELVIGEVACDAGRWSIYPYRFSRPQGFGHAELGDDVYKVFNHDTLCIPAGRTHAQAAAPGYGMWYLWVVRHLPDAPYQGFTYDAEHEWLLDARQQGWI